MDDPSNLDEKEILRSSALRELLTAPLLTRQADQPRATQGPENETEPASPEPSFEQS